MAKPVGLLGFSRIGDSGMTFCYFEALTIARGLLLLTPFVPDGCDTAPPAISFKTDELTNIKVVELEALRSSCTDISAVQSENN